MVKLWLIKSLSTLKFTHSVIRVDYGYDFYNHHFETSHVHVGTPGVDEIAYEIDSDIIQKAFPDLFNPVQYNIDFETENGMIYAIEEAIKCFLITVHANNVDEIRDFYYDD